MGNYEFCPRCEANLTLQKGFSRELPNWICKGCGEMLINPGMDTDIVWVCDGCGATLNIQQGFHDDCGTWQCLECGFINEIDESKVYLSDDEYQSDLNNPYRGLSDEAVLDLNSLEDIGTIDGHNNVILVRDIEDDGLYVKKYLDVFNRDIFEFFYDNPQPGMPEIYALYESDNCLIVIEEYIEGKTVEKMLLDGPLAPDMAVRIAGKVCEIAEGLHELNPPVIHRDIKPSNIIVSQTGEIYLLDINAAKWYDADSKEDTVLLGTHYYAAPEQYGFGNSSSSEKADVYAIGMLLNKLITGSFPKEKMAEGMAGIIVKECVCLEADERISGRELLNRLNELQE